MSANNMPEDTMLHFRRSILSSRPGTTAAFYDLRLEDEGGYADVYREGNRIMRLPRTEKLQYMFSIAVYDFDSSKSRASQDIKIINSILSMPLLVVPASYLLEESHKNVPLSVEVQFGSPALDVQTNGCERMFLPMSCRDGHIYYIDQSVQPLTPFVYNADTLRHMSMHNNILFEPLPEAKPKPKRTNAVFDILRAM